jgi:hypothetical protein
MTSLQSSLCPAPLSWNILFATFGTPPCVHRLSPTITNNQDKSTHKQKREPGLVVHD